MSAYVVDDKTINGILPHLSAQEFDTLARAACDTFTLERDDVEDGVLGEALRTLNVAAVLQRYPDCSVERGDLPGPHPFLPYRYAPILAGGGSKVQALKSLRCLLYQCSEGTIPETPLYKALDDLSSRWALEIVEKLPEYDRARWG
jgi:hypothetical protein